MLSFSLLNIPHEDFQKQIVKSYARISPKSKYKCMHIPLLWKNSNPACLRNQQELTKRKKKNGT